MFGLGHKVLAMIGGGLAAVLALALAATIISKNATIGTLEDRIEKLDADNARCVKDLGTVRANQATLEESIKAQNASLEAMAAQGQARLAQGAKDRSTASFTAKNNATRAAALATAKAGADQCASADALIKESLK